jgi:hypothetical protein
MAQVPSLRKIAERRSLLNRLGSLGDVWVPFRVECPIRLDPCWHDVGVSATRSAALAGRLPTCHRFPLGLSIALSTLASETPGHAADRTPFHLGYSSPASCPSRTQVLAQLQARAAHLVEARPTDTAPRFRIDVNVHDAGVDTSVQMTLLDGSYSRRVLRTNDCGEAIAAATVIMALVLSPQQTDTVTEGGPPAQQEPPEARDDSHERREASPAAPPAAPRRSVHPIETRTPFQFGAGAQLGAPTTMFGATIGGGGFIEAQLYPGDWVSPSVRVAVLAQGADEPDDRGTAEMQLLTGRLSLCPVRIPAKTRAFARPCALAELGRLRGRGTGTVDGREVVTPWRAVGALVRAVWSFPVVALELEGAAVFPLTRDAFYFDPRPVEPTFEVHGVHASVLVGLSAHFP